MPLFYNSAFLLNAPPLPVVLQPLVQNDTLVFSGFECELTS